MSSHQGNHPIPQLSLNDTPNDNAMAAFQQRLQQTQQPQPHHQQQQHGSNPQHPQGTGGAQLPPGTFAGAMNPSMSENIPATLQANQLAARQVGLTPQQGMGDGQMQMQDRPMYPRSPIDIQGTYDKMQRFLQSIRDTEMRIKQYQLQQQVSGGSDHLAAEIDKLQKDLQRRREVLRRVKAYFRDVVQLFASCTPGGVAPPMNPSSASQVTIPDQGIQGEPTNPVPDAATQNGLLAGAHGVHRAPYPQFKDEQHKQWFLDRLADLGAKLKDPDAYRTTVDQKDLGGEREASASTFEYTSTTEGKQ